jgi:hypothetical protein
MFFGRADHSASAPASASTPASTESASIRYFSSIGDAIPDTYIVSDTARTCEWCARGEMIAVPEEGIHVCNVCSRSVHGVIKTDRPSYKEPPKEVCLYAYKRINHFKEIISQFQGKESTHIPDDVMDAIRKQIQRERIDMPTLTSARLRIILKRLGFSKRYDHIAFIMNKLGVPPPQMSPQLEDTLFRLFAEIQEPYERHCPENRVNFLNYYYTAYKLCEMLNLPQYLNNFHMLQDHHKLNEQDAIWRKICQDLDWPFVPTSA